jgi:hypothetical protein
VQVVDWFSESGKIAVAMIERAQRRSWQGQRYQLHGRTLAHFIQPTGQLRGSTIGSAMTWDTHSPLSWLGLAVSFFQLACGWPAFHYASLENVEWLTA